MQYRNKPALKLKPCMWSLTCRTTSWHGVSRDDSWVAETAEVQPVPVVVVLSTNKQPRKLSDHTT